MTKPALVGWRGALYGLHYWLTYTDRRSYLTYMAGAITVWVNLRYFGGRLADWWLVPRLARVHPSHALIITTAVLYWSFWLVCVYFPFIKYWCRWIRTHGAFNDLGRPV